jgi:hypothetical protein
MMLRRSLPVTAALATFVAPLAALADPTGTVTTDPVHLAPTLGLPLLVVLAIALAGITVFRLRRAAVGPIAAVVLVAGVIALAGLAYAINTIVISGADCMRQTVSVFDPGGSTALRSDCPNNSIRIIDIQTSCGGVNHLSTAPTGITTFAPCEIGLTLAHGDECELPTTCF